MTARATLHGNVMLELIGQMPWLGDQGGRMCQLSLMHLWTIVDHVHEQARDQAATAHTGR